MTIKTDLKKHWKAGCVFAGIVFFFLAALFMLGLNKLADSTPRSCSIAPAESPPEAACTLSNEQKGLLAELGYPEAFSLHFYQDDQTEIPPGFDAFGDLDLLSGWAGSDALERPGDRTG
jgi:hypothetical protein